MGPGNDSEIKNFVQCRPGEKGINCKKSVLTRTKPVHFGANSVEKKNHVLRRVSDYDPCSTMHMKLSFLNS